MCLRGDIFKVALQFLKSRIGLWSNTTAIKLSGLDKMRGMGAALAAQTV
ncbi:MAG TPA: hypothetical protein VIF10_15780 [Methylobacter sp.]|jgi:hypothetical protein